MFKIEFDENNPVAVQAADRAIRTFLIPQHIAVVPEPEKEYFKPEPEAEAAPITDNKPQIAPITEEASENDGSELDSAGMTWDKRIHARTKTKNADGTWKILRRPQKDFPTDAEWKDYIRNCQAEQMLGDQPPAPEPEQAPPPPAPDKSDDDLTLTDVLKLITGNKIPMDKVTEICNEYDLKSVNEMSNETYSIYIPHVYNDLKALV